MRSSKLAWLCVLIIGITPSLLAKSHVSQPEYLETPAPVYPKGELELHHEGTVQVRVQVTEDGLAQNATVMVSSGFRELDKAAVEAINRWKFIAAKIDGRPVSTLIVVPVTFSLNSLAGVKSVQRKNWVYTMSHEDVDYYISKDSLEVASIVPKINYIWTLKNFKSPKPIGNLGQILSIVERIKIDCVRGSMQTTMLAGFSDRYGSGKVIITDPQTQSSHAVGPGTVGWYLERFSCVPEKPAQHT